MKKKKPIIKTLSVRIKSKHISKLKRMAFEANQIWNAANEETSIWSWVPVAGYGYFRNYISAFQLQKQLKDIRAERGMIIHSGSAQEVIAEHAKKRKQFKKSKLNWRTSGGSRKSLGWIPFKAGAASWKSGQVFYNGNYYKVWDSYGLANYKFKSGTFSEDSRGRWYFNVAVEVQPERPTGKGQIGIDLGLKTYATCSDGTTLEATKFYRNSEKQLAMAQRAKKKKLVKTINAKTKNRRSDSLHKFSTK